MSNINTDIISHELKIESIVKLVALKIIGYGYDERLEVTKEMGKLLNAALSERFVTILEWSTLSR